MLTPLNPYNPWWVEPGGDWRANPTARQAVALLQKHRMLKEVSGRQWGKLYLAQPILDVIDKP